MNEPIDIDGEACRLETDFIVFPVESDMIELAKSPFPVLGGLNGWVLISSVSGQVKGDLQDGPATGSQEADQLRHRLLVFGNVFKNVAAVDRVERVIRILNVC